MGAYVGGAATHTTGVINGLRRRAASTYASSRPSGRTRIDARASRRSSRRERLHSFVHWLTLSSTRGSSCARPSDAASDAVYQRYALGSYAGLELAQRLARAVRARVQRLRDLGDAALGHGPRPAGGDAAARSRSATSATRRSSSSCPTCSRSSSSRSADPDAERILVNPNGVDAERARRAARADGPRQWRAATGRAEAPTVGFVGTFGFWHGVKVLPAMIEARRARASRRALGADRRRAAARRGPRRTSRRRGLADSVELTGVLRTSAPSRRWRPATSACRRTCRTRTARASSAPPRSSSSTWG